VVFNTANQIGNPTLHTMPGEGLSPLLVLTQHKVLK
jgi:hypothetical protein